MQQLKSKPIVVYPILFAIFPILGCISNQAGKLLPAELFWPVAVAALAAAVVFLALALLLRSAYRAGVVTAVWASLFFTFQPICSAGNALFGLVGIKPFDPAYYVLPYLALFAFAFFLCARSRRSFEELTSVLNIVSALLVIGNVVPLVAYEVRVKPALTRVLAENERQEGEIELVRPDPAPDIYYVILDCFANSATLKETYGYDNSAFIQHLKDKGFFVVPEARSNFDRTILSLSSSLNMRYITDFADELPANSNDSRIPFELIQRNQIEGLLKRLGYKIVNISSGFSPSDYNPYADLNVRCGWNNRLNVGILQLTVFGALERKLHILGDAVRTGRLCFFAKINEIDDIPGPKFVFAHVLMPHPPFVFREDGTGLPLSASLMSESYTVDKYLGQLKFVEKQTIKAIDTLLARKRTRPLIFVLQSDHGPEITPLPDDRHPSAAFVKERLRILNACLVPGRDGSLFYDSITPVNSLRVILNRYFGAHLKLLDDRSFYAPKNFPYQFMDVTATLTQAQEPASMAAASAKSRQETAEPTKSGLRPTGGE